MPEKTEEVKTKLKSLGLSNDVVQAAWPVWWSDDAEKSPSALNDLKFSVARKLGISPSSLFDEGDATFVWQGDAKFKGLRARSIVEQNAMIAFGHSVTRLLLTAVGRPAAQFDQGASAIEIRSSILRSGAPYVTLADMLALSWAAGIPVIHLRVFPLEAKRMAAMTVRLDERYAILLGHDSQYPAPICFDLAHELGHIARGHLTSDSAIIDLKLAEDKTEERDEEEVEADEFALAMLTGRPKPDIVATRAPRNSAELANSALKASATEHIEPGTLALCYGHATGEWRLANAALKGIYPIQRPIWREVNKLAMSLFDTEELTPDNLDFLFSIMGLP